MKQRFFSSGIIIILLILTVACSGIPFVLNSIIAVIAAAGLYEVLSVSGMARCKGLLAGGMIFTGAFVFFSDPVIPQYRTWLTLATFLLIIGFFTYHLRGYRTVSPSNMMFTMMMTLLMAYFFSAVVLVRTATVQGFWNLILLFLLAWVPDTGAYLCGSAFGKHKLAPTISPKKTVEGALGGIVACIGISYLYAWLVGTFAGVKVNYWAIAVYAVMGTLISILGDLTASLIKRHYKIKDYGTLIPGHGGIMDRFDSIWLVAPFVWLMTNLFPAFL